jgi:hypothetical protein
MVYFEFRLEGHVKVYDMSDQLMILRAAIETKAQALPVAQTIEDAHSYFQAGCFQFEMFESVDDAAAWVEGYTGFREAAAATSFAYYLIRRADLIDAEAA